MVFAIGLNFVTTNAQVHMGHMVAGMLKSGFRIVISTLQFVIFLIAKH